MLNNEPEEIIYIKKQKALLLKQLNQIIMETANLIYIIYHININNGILS
jgi:hypothetical protein